jgi:hypothetical protein
MRRLRNEAVTFIAEPVESHLSKNRGQLIENGIANGVLAPAQRKCPPDMPGGNV